MKTVYRNHNESPLKEEWIHQQPITQDVIDWAEGFGEYLTIADERGPLSTGQIRKFYGEVKRIGANISGNKSDILMLRPFLAYAVGRDKKFDPQLRRMINKTKIKDFEEEMSVALSAIREDHLISDFQNFEQIFEAIVAYHKYYGGKENNN